MNKRLATTLLVFGAFALPLAAIAGTDSDMARSHPKAFVKESVYTTKVKSRLAA